MELASLEKRPCRVMNDKGAHACVHSSCLRGTRDINHGAFPPSGSIYIRATCEHSDTNDRGKMKARPKRRSPTLSKSNEKQLVFSNSSLELENGRCVDRKTQDSS